LLLAGCAACHRQRADDEPGCGAGHQPPKRRLGRACRTI